MIVSVLFRLERAKWYKEVLSKPKLRTYRIFKQEYEPEPYINVVTSRAHRAFLARLRGGSATLEIETGRYVGIPAEQRVCKLCHSGIGDEAHFILTCPALQESRLPLYNLMLNSQPSFNYLSMDDKLCAVMIEANKSRRVMKIFYSMFMKRQLLLHVK